MSVTYASLSSKSPVAELQSYCQALVHEIDDRLKMASVKGETYIKFELPNTFPKSRLSKIDSQIWMYSEIINIYNKRGFNDNIHITSTDGKLWLIISWLRGLDAEERAAREAIITGVMRKAQS